MTGVGEKNDNGHFSESRTGDPKPCKTKNHLDLQVVWFALIGVKGQEGRFIYSLLNEEIPTPHPSSPSRKLKPTQNVPVV